MLDDLTTGIAAAVPAGPRSTSARTATRRASSAPLDEERHRGDPPLRGPLARRRVVRDPATYYRDNVAGGVAAARGGAGRPASGSSSRRPPRSTATRTEPDQEDAALRPINTYGETKLTFEGALRWYGAGVRHAQREPALLQRRGRHRALGEGHDPETHLIPNVLAAAEGGPR